MKACIYIFIAANYFHQPLILTAYIVLAGYEIVSHLRGSVRQDPMDKIGNVEMESEDLLAKNFPEVSENIPPQQEATSQNSEIANDQPIIEASFPVSIKHENVNAMK